MKYLKIAVILACLPFLSMVAAHKFYISVTNVDYVEKDNAVQIITRVFVDDINTVLKERYGVETKLGSDMETIEEGKLLEKYLRTKFVVGINGKTVSYDFIGKKYDTDMIICYLEVPKVSAADLRQIAIQNEMLMDIYDEQQNVVHVKAKGAKKSFVLVRTDTKGMLNL